MSKKVSIRRLPTGVPGLDNLLGCWICLKRDAQNHFDLMSQITIRESSSSLFNSCIDTKEQ